MPQRARVLVIADDATGANASAALLAVRGLSARTVFRLPRVWPRGVDAVTLSIDSRHLPPAQAQARARAAAGWGRRHGARCVGKRIDSTLRGNLGAEVAGVLAALPGAAALVVPAFPRSDRLAVGGRVLWRGRPLGPPQERGGGDRRTGVSHVPTLLRIQTSLAVAHVPLRAVRRGRAALVRALEQARAGARIVVADAATDRDLARLAAAARAGDRRWVPVDPGPFTAAYVAERLVAPRGTGGPAGPRRTPARVPAKPAPASRPCVLAVIGSRTSLTRRQIDALRASGAAVITVPAAGRDGPWGVGALASREAVVLCSRPEPVPVASGVYTGRLARAARRLLEACGGRIAGLYVSGGDTLREVVRALGAEAVHVTAEVEPLVAAGRLVGGRWAGLPVVSKGGLVGDAETATRCVHRLRQTSV
jgi:uncharacterized protein YgbK (DUF1537 family)